MRFRKNTSVFHVYHGDGFTPISLSREEPIAKFIGNLVGPLAHLDEPVRDGLSGLIVSKTIGKFGVDVPSLSFVGRLADIAFDDLDHGDVMLFGEFIVTLIVGGNGHDGACGIGREDIVPDIDRDFLPVDGIDGIRAEEDSRLFLASVRSFHVRFLGAGLDVRLDFRFSVGFRQSSDQRMLRCQDAIGAPEKGIRTRREDVEGKFLPHHVESDQGTFAPPDPVSLHRQGGRRPLDRIESGKEFVGVGRDLQTPLAHGTSFDGISPALALAVDDFLVCEDRPESWAPVDESVVLIGKALLIEFRENPLGPFIIGRIACLDFPVPVIGKTEPFQLLPEIVDVSVGINRRVLIVLDGKLLRRQAEGVIADRVQDVEALHSLHPRKGIGRRIAFDVAHMETDCGRVGEHVQDIVFRLGKVVTVRVIRLFLVPDLFPLFFDVLEFVGHRKPPCLINQYEIIQFSYLFW